MNTQAYDLIGDIHGQHGKLAAMLAQLGYHLFQAAAGATWRHPHGRKVIFLGDYIDRGPEVRAVLQTVRAMTDAGDAYAIMGNHEYNCICYHTPDGRGGWLRPRHLDAYSGHLVTLAQFAGLEQEWDAWRQWMRALPMFLDLGGLRAVHACWDAKRIGRLQGKTLADPAFLIRSGTRGTPEYRAVQNTLKGPELAMPEGRLFHDKEGIARNTVRVRWWDMPAAGRVSALAMPEPFDVPGDAAPHDLRRLPNYPADEPPVFCGHYWLPPERQRLPLAANIACLDFSAAVANNPLVAYRWDGERQLTAAKFVTATL